MARTDNDKEPLENTIIAFEEIIDSQNDISQQKHYQDFLKNIPTDSNERKEYISSLKKLIKLEKRNHQQIQGEPNQQEGLNSDHPPPPNHHGDHHHHSSPPPPHHHGGHHHHSPPPPHHHGGHHHHCPPPHHHGGHHHCPPPPPPPPHHHGGHHHHCPPPPPPHHHGGHHHHCPPPPPPHHHGGHHHHSPPPPPPHHHGGHHHHCPPSPHHHGGHHHHSPPPPPPPHHHGGHHHHCPPQPHDGNEYPPQSQTNIEQCICRLNRKKQLLIAKIQSIDSIIYNLESLNKQNYQNNYLQSIQLQPPIQQPQQPSIKPQQMCPQFFIPQTLNFPQINNSVPQMYVSNSSPTTISTINKCTQ
ncbi:hypothetical protein ACTFIW_006565 [Dictyostelium discoideum]